MNKNCLEGYRCPRCKSLGPLMLPTESMTEWDDDGTGYGQELSISSEGIGHCSQCGHSGSVTSFDLRKDYLESGGMICPYCQSTNIEGRSVDIDGGKAYQKVFCVDCAGTWQDEYTLTAVALLEPGEDTNED